MRHSHIGIMSVMMAAGMASVSVEPERSDGSRKPRKPAKPSGQTIPDGTITRQQRRAAERRAIKDLPK